MNYVRCLGKTQVNTIVQIARIMAINMAQSGDMFRPINRSDIQCTHAILHSLHSYCIIKYDYDNNAIIPSQSTLAHYMIYYAHTLCSENLLDASIGTMTQNGSTITFHNIINGESVIVTIPNAELIDILHYRK